MWYVVIVILLVFGGLQLIKAATQISESQARELIKKGAVILDVRTEAEFQARSIAGVTNVPLDRFEKTLPKLATDKGQPVLLHCQSGARSGMAVKTAEGLGYTNVHNLGSFERARKIIEQK
jgi:phage shock protein E